jgi:hypothetical protein
VALAPEIGNSVISRGVTFAGPDETLHVILDNASFHLKVQVLQCAAAHRIRFYFFAPTAAASSAISRPCGSWR